MRPYLKPASHVRLSRRRVLGQAALATASIAAAVQAACSSSKSGQKPAQPGSAAPAASSPAARQPKRGGTLVHQNSQEARGETFDPATSTPLKGEAYRLFYQSLLDYDPVTYEVRPQLAEKWEQPSPGEYLFHIQPGVKWHDKPPASGRPLKVEDIVFTLKRAGTKDPQFTAASLLDNVDQIQAPDAATIRITSKTPDAAQLSKLSSDQFLVLAPEVVDKAGKFTTADTAVGTGPFMVQSAGEKVGGQFVRNPNYWKPGLPYLDALRTVYLGEGTPGDQVEWSGFLSGQVHTALVPGDQVKQFLTQQPKGYTPEWYAYNSGYWPATPNTKVAPFDDVRVTRALRLLIDHDEWRTAWAQVWGGRGRYASIIQAALEIWDLSEDEYSKYLEWKQPKDDAVKEALALLGAAGFTADHPLKFELATNNDQFGLSAAQLVQAQWRRLGRGVVDSALKVYDTASYQAIRASRNYAYGSFSNLTSFIEPDAYFSQLYRSGASRNYWNFSDPALDVMFDKQRGMFDQKQRMEQVREIIIYMIDHFPGVIGAARYSLNAAKPEVRNHRPEFWLHGSQYEQVWLDT
jgi:peptide/nickel transport system substrate-binding protein